jgi:hypothetical protein
MRNYSIQAPQPTAARVASLHQADASAARMARATSPSRALQDQPLTLSNSIANPGIQMHMLTTLPGITEPGKLVAGSTVPAGGFFSGFVCCALIAAHLTYLVDLNYHWIGRDEPFLGTEEDRRRRRKAPVW